MAAITKKAFVSNKDETPKLFKNEFLETLTKVHPAVPVIIFAPIVVYLLNEGLIQQHGSFKNIFGLFLSGLFFWTGFEYLLHRTVFHWVPNNSFGQRIHFLFHGIHHDFPKDSRRLVMPPVVSIFLSTVIYYGFQSFIPAHYLDGFYAGFLFGYLCYDMIHFAIHHFNFKNKWFLMVRNHHFIHHYQDEKSNFGVSSPLWDLIIRTAKK